MYLAQVDELNLILEFLRPRSVPQQILKDCVFLMMF